LPAGCIPILKVTTRELITRSLPDRPLMLLVGVVIVLLSLRGLARYIESA
jgi:hypothetical protein